MSGPFRSFRPTRPVASAPTRLHVETLESRTVPAIFDIASGDVAGLVAAITTSNTNGEADTINLAAGGTFTLTAVDNTTTGANGLPVVLADGGNGLTVNGNGAVIERDAAAPNMRILEVNNAGSLLSISGVTVRGGKDPGADGGGIRLDANATLSLSDSTVTANAITGGNRGGGIGTVSGSTLSVTSSVISGNSTGGKGGGISVYGSIVTPATVTMQNSQVTGNTGGSRGGGAFLYNSTVTIQNSTLSGNTTSNRGGGAFLYKCTTVVQNSTIEGNTSANRGGGLFLYKGTTTVANTTISGNTTTGGTGFGGGVVLYKGTHTLTNCTITGNTASQQGGGVYVENAATVANLQNTIVAENTDTTGANDIFRTSGTLNASNSLLQNLPGGTINGTDVSNITGVSPLLGPIQNNGGTTRTRAPLSGSPVLGAGDSAFAGSLTTDQRGRTRVTGGQIDIGAVEAQPPAITSGNSATFTVGSAGTFTVTTTGELTILLSSVGGLPSGVTFTDNGDGTGTLAGTPDAGTGGTYNLTFQAANGVTPNGSQSFTLTVNQAPAITSADAATFTAGHAGTFTVTTTGFPTSALSVTGGLPNGVALVDNGDGTATLSGTPTQSGQFVVTITAANGTSPNASQSFTLTVHPRPVIVSATPGGGAGDATVRVYDVLTGQTQTYTPFPGFGGNVSTATGDLTGDGIPDLVAAAGAGGGPHVKVFDGATGNEILSTFVFDARFMGGVNVAVGDVNGDGRADLIVGAGAGGGPHVKVFDGTTFGEIASFFAYDAAFTGGVSVAAGDLDGDGAAEVITGAGAGGGPHVKAFDGRTLAEVRSFFAYDAAFTGGVNVAAGDLDGDGRAEIVTGAGAGGGPHVRAFDGQTGVEEASFFAYDAAFAGGVFVATGDLDADGYDDIITGAGPGGGPHVKAFSGRTLNEFVSFFATDPSFHGGVVVG